MKGSTRIYADITLVVLFVMLILLGMIFCISIPDGTVNMVDIDMTEGWTSDDGSYVSVLELNRSEGVHRMWRTISSDMVKGASLCTDESNLLFDVYLDDELIYSFHPSLPRFYGNYYGNYAHFIAIPQFEGTKTLTISYESLYDSSWSSFRNMRLMEGADYYRQIMQNEFAKFLQCFVVLLAGLVMVVCGFIFDKDRARFTETVSLGVMAVMLACYSNSGSLLIQAVTNNSAVPRMIELITLMLLPIPTIIFISAFTECINKWYVKAIIGLSTANTIVNFVIVRLTKLDFHDVLFVSHMIIGIGLGLCGYMIIRYVRKKGRKRGMAMLGVSVVIVFIAGAGDLLRYYFANSQDTALLTRYGLLIFIILMGYSEVRELISISEKSIKTELMQKVAYTDALTGISNREAFYEYESEIKKKESLKCVIMQMDLNYLKKANDEYGHGEGDKLIVAAAICIDESLGGFGRCFRTGGDEFTAIIVGKMENAMKAFEKRMEEINNDKEIDLQVPLSIAYGTAEYVAGRDKLEDVEALADSRMYECKKQMKAGRQD
ncbi:diguanylate cyclase (GGDEF) domain-containing protein [Ruminococcaceae bacterium YRB3002]|nr:diguanylate cyclase (GGDEF) domain-containing protein [Ruminococcaceae bacterium YRB3002]